MKVIQIKSIQPDLRRYVRHFCTPSDNAEMVCAALNHDVGVQCKVALDDRGVAGAVSYMVRETDLHICSLGSLVKGAGTRLMQAVEGLAKRRHLPVTVTASKGAVGFYEGRGYKVVANADRSVVQMAKTIVRVG